MTDKGFKLEVGKAPEKVRAGIYDQIIAEFAKEVLDNPAVKDKSAKVVMPDRAVKTMQIGLAKAASATKRKDIMVSIRNGEIWLLKK